MAGEPTDEDRAGDGKIDSLGETAPTSGATTTRTADDEHPKWWRTASAVFEAHSLVEYQPPRFTDGTVIYEIITPLEADLGVKLDFMGCGKADDEEWFIRVDGRQVAKINHRRRIGGQTVYEMAPETFEELVREAVADS